MAKGDDGHYELVLGNRQLVSGFFVLIILFAIFLTLGYVLGRNSVVVNEAPVSAALEAGTVDGPRNPERPASTASARPSASEPAPLAGTEPAPRAEPVASPATQPAVTQPVATRPVTEAPRETTAPKPTAENNAASQPPSARTPVSIPETQASKAQEILNSRVRLITPRPGDTFVQVAAVSRAEAELMAEQLGRRGYRALISEVPGKELYRVLIGPFETPAKLNETRTKLTQEGINNIVQRY